MNPRRLIDILISRLPGTTPAEKRWIQKELSMLGATVKDIGTTIGPSGSVSSMHSGNLTLDQTGGLKLYNPFNGKLTINLESDGDAKFGSDLAFPADTSLGIFSNDQTYNSEAMGKGDVLLGDNTSGKANLLWDRSTGRLNFRGGTTVHAYVGTDGRIYAGSGAIIIDATSIRSGNYSAGVGGFSINPAGDAEFQNIIARGEFHASVFVKNLVNIQAGTLLLGKGGGVLAADMTVPTSGTWTMAIKDPPGGGFAFANNDYVQFRQFFGSSLPIIYCVVGSRTDNLDGTQSYVCTYASGDRSVERVYSAGNAVFSYGGGTSGGFLFMTADATNNPYYSVRSWATNPWDPGNITERVRMGNLNGYLGYLSEIYGIGIGSSSGTDANITFDPTNGIRIRQGTTNKITFDNSGNAAFAGVISIGTSGGIYQGSGTFASPTTGLKMWNDGGVGRIGGFNSGTLQWYADTDGKLYAGGGDLRIDADGIVLKGDGSLTNPRMVRFLRSSNSALFGALYTSWAGAGNPAITWLRGQVPSGSPGWTEAEVIIGPIKSGTDMRLSMHTNGTTTLSGGSKFVLGSGVDIYSVAWTDYSGISTVIGWSSFTVKKIYYKKVGKLVFVTYDIQGTSDATSASFSTPAANNANVEVNASVDTVVDNGVVSTTPGRMRMVASGGTAQLYKNTAAAGWTDSGTKHARGQFWYEAA